MASHLYKTWIEISRSALTHNAGVFKKLIGPKKQLLAVIKANAYGHDAEKVIAPLIKGGVTWLGVDSIDEALRIESVRNDLQVLILGYTLNDRLEEALAHGYRLTVYNPETIKSLGEITRRLKLPAILHVKCETGTSRQGVLPEDLVPLVKLIKKYPKLVLEGISTHFANIEDTSDHSYADTQLLKFKRLVHSLENIGIRVPIKHAACTAATILFPEAHLNMVRVGHGIYGLKSLPDAVKELDTHKLYLKPVLSWKTKIAQVKKLPRGTPIGYGLTERLSRDSRVAVIPVGYADGYDRKLSRIGQVLIGNQRAKILGRVCMNMMMADVTNIRGVKVEDNVVLIGRQGREVITANDLAAKIDTIDYEIVSRINPLIPRFLVMN